MKHINAKILAAVLTVLALCVGYWLAASGGIWQTAGVDSSQDVSLDASADPVESEEIASEGTRVGADITPEYLAAAEATRPATDAYQRARKLYFEHSYDQAFVEAQKAVDLARESYAALIIEDGQRLQGKIRLAQGRYTEALELLKVKYMVGRSTILDLDIALCYVKLGDLARAREFYSDSAIVGKYLLTERDVPGTDTAANFEASIRLARGMDYYGRSLYQPAFEELVLAEALAPNIGAISYYAGRTLIDLDRYLDSKPYFERAIQNASGRMLEDAQRRHQNMR